MLPTVTLLFALLAHGQCAPPSRIIGGSDASQGEHPWGVSIQVMKWGTWQHAYDGVWLGGNRVLTAAHSLDGRTPSSVQVVLGEHRLSVSEDSQQTIGVDHFVFHPDYDINSPGYPNDLVIVHLSREATADNWTQTVAMATPGMDFTGTQCAISGWGRVSDTGGASDILQHANVTQISNEECSTRWSTVAGTAILPTHICAFDSGKAACSGDNGGPMVCSQNGQDYLAGVTSWGSSSCTGMPTVYVRVSEFLDWIFTH